MLKLEHGQIIADGTPAEILLPQRASGRLQLAGTLLKIESAGVAALLTIACGNDIIASIVSLDEAQCYSIGETVAVNLSGANAKINHLA